MTSGKACINQEYHKSDLFDSDYRFPDNVGCLPLKKALQRTTSVTKQLIKVADFKTLKWLTSQQKKNQTKNH